MNTIIDKIDQIKTKLTDNEYLELMNTIQSVYDRGHPNWNDLCDELENNDETYVIPMAIDNHLSSTHSDHLALTMARIIHKQSNLIHKLESVICDQAIAMVSNNPYGLDL